MDNRTRFAFAFTVVAWASAFPGIRIALTAYSPSQLAFFRFFLAALALLALGVAAGHRRPPWRDLVRMALLGVIGVAYYAVALGYGQKQVPAGSASLLISSAPVWMVVIAAAIGRERPTMRAVASIAISFAGVVLIALGRGVGLTSGRHALAVLSAAMAGAVYTIAQRPLVAKYGALPVTIVAVIGGALALSPTAVGLPAAIQAAPAPATLAIVYLAIFPGALGYAAWAYASARASTAVAGSALYLVPAVSMLLSNLLLGEVPSAFALVGGVLVLAGAAMLRTRGTSRPLVAVAVPAATGGGMQRKAA